MARERGRAIMSVVRYYSFHVTAYFLLLFAMLGCNKLFPVDTGTGSGRGIVRRIDYEHHLITLEHGTVPKLLSPMMYSYPLISDSIMKPIKEGDTVHFTIEELKLGEFRVLTLQKIHPKPRR
ncbi:MAG: copper-binding protein [Bacteroidota bacterium]|nr:copper-binding protein [Bacteroidota bacterium]MDP4231821.1 copper-binding protein [Bacteroidota bacterium]MDP4242707.1 copper-binding protein [Bacteroidota bacterium]MDP4287158.1 copper-binding protein [Bacteroidota bacterium]